MTTRSSKKTGPGNKIKSLLTYEEYQATLPKKSEEGPDDEETKTQQQELAEPNETRAAAEMQQQSSTNTQQTAAAVQAAQAMQNFGPISLWYQYLATMRTFAPGQTTVTPPVKYGPPAFWEYLGTPSQTTTAPAKYGPQTYFEYIQTRKMAIGPNEADDK